jgi:hypothetical protein
MEVEDKFIKMQFYFLSLPCACLASKFAKSVNESQKFRIDVDIENCKKSNWKTFHCNKSKKNQFFHEVFVVDSFFA